MIDSAIEGIKGADTGGLVKSVRDTSVSIADRRRSGRIEILKAAAGEIDPDTGLAVTHAMIWLDRLGYHLWRTINHLADIKDRESESSGVFEESEGR